MSNDYPDLTTEQPLGGVASTPSKRELAFRIVITLVLLGSLALAWHSTARVLAPRLQESRTLISSVSDLQKQIDTLEHKFTPAQLQEITNKFEQIGSQLFGSPAALEDWLNTLREQALPLGLDLQTELGTPATQNAGGRKFAVIPATVTVDAQAPGGAGGLASPCQRILRLTQFLAAQEKRTDLVEMAVSSNSTNSINHGVLVLNCWAGGEGP